MRITDGDFELSLDRGSRDIVSVCIGILLGILILLVVRWLSKVITRYASRSMERAHVDGMVIGFTKTLIYIGLMVTVVIAALNAAGIHTTSLTALLPSAGAAIGLALKDSLANLAAGVMILIFKPYRTDDCGQVHSEMLEQIKLRFNDAGISVPFPTQDVYLHQVT